MGTVLWLMGRSPLEKTPSPPTTPWHRAWSRPCRRRCSTTGCRSGEESPGRVVVNLVSIHGMLQDQLRFMEMDVGSMGETLTAVLVEVKPLASAAAGLET